MSSNFGVKKRITSEVSRKVAERQLQEGANPTDDLYVNHTNVHVRRLAFLKMVKLNKGSVNIQDVKLADLKINEDWFNEYVEKCAGENPLPFDEEDVALASAE